MFKNDMQRFRPDTYPMAEKKAIVVSGNVRFTVLTDRIIRCENSNSGIFEDRASQHIWNRNCSAPLQSNFTDGILTIETTYLKLKYKIGAAFENSLTILIKENNHEWHYGDVDNDNLLGTART